MSQYLAQLREALGSTVADKSDEDLLKLVSDATGKSLGQVADEYGYDPGVGSMNRERLSSSIDRYQSSLYDVGSTVAGAVGLRGWEGFLDERRRANEIQGQVAAERAAGLGAIDRFSDVHSLSDLGNYATGLGISTLPYMGEALAGGLTGGAAFGPTLGRTAGRLFGAAAASYPSAMGEIASAQRDQGYEPQLDVMATAGIPYAALNLLGVEGALARGQLFRSGVRALDDIPGVRGALARTGVSGVRTGLTEGVAETGQEALSQFGRGVVDPTEGMLGPQALERYGEAFAGGATLGGILGGVGGGWRRSAGYRPTIEEQPDLLQREPAFEPIPVPTPPPTVPMAPPAPMAPEAPVAPPADFQDTEPLVTVLPGLPPNPNIPPPEPTDEDRLAEQVRQRREQFAQSTERAKKVGLTATKQFELFDELERLRDEGGITANEFEEQVQELAVPKYHTVRATIKRIRNAMEGQRLVEQQQAEARAAEPPVFQAPPAPPVQAPVIPPQGVSDAVPVQGPAAVPVRQAAEGGQEVRRQDAQGRQVARKEVTPEKIKRALATLGTRDRSIVNDALGVDEEGSQVNQPMPYAEIGKKHGISRQAVQAVLKRVGVTKEVIDRFAATYAQPVSESELLGATEEGEGTGMRVVDRPNQADDFELDPRTVRAQRETEQTLQQAAGAPLAEAEARIAARKAEADAAFEEKRRQAAADAVRRAEEREARAARKIQTEFEQADIDYAKSEWNLGSLPDDPIWDELPNEQVERWVRAANAYGEDKISAQVLERVHGEIADEVKQQRQAVQGVAGRAGELVLEGGPGAPGAGVPRLRGGSEGGAAAASGRAVGEGSPRGDGPDSAAASGRVEARGRVGASTDLTPDSPLYDTGFKRPREFVGSPSKYVKWLESTEEETSGDPSKAPPDLERWTISAAVETLVNSNFGGFFRHALTGVNRVGVFKGDEQGVEHSSAYYNFVKRWMSFSRLASGIEDWIRARPGSMDSQRALEKLTSITAHELTHAADFTAAAALGAPPGTPIGANSDSVVFVDLVDRGGVPGIAAGPVTHESLGVVLDMLPILRGERQSQTMEEAEKRLIVDSFLNYPLSKLVRVIDALAFFSTRNRRELLQFVMDNRDAIGDAVWIATNELAPSLVQMRLSRPIQMRKYFPQAYTFTSKLLNAKTTQEVARAFGVESQDGKSTGPSATSTFARVGEDRAGPAGVQEQVRGDRVAAAGREIRGLRRWGAQGPVDGRPYWSSGPSAGRSDRLNAPGGTSGFGDLPPPPTTPQGWKGWIDGFMQGKWRAAPWLLGWLSTEQLAERFADLPGKAGAAVKAFHQGMTKMAVRANTLMNMSDRHKKRWEQLRREHGTDKDSQFIDFLLESTRTQIWAMRPLEAEENAHLPAEIVDGPGGTKRKVHSALLVDEHARLARAWERLPTAYQAFFHQLQNDFALKYEAKVKAFLQNIINGHYPNAQTKNAPSKEMIDRAALVPKRQRKAFLKEHAKSKLATDTYRSLWSDIDEHAREFPSKLVGPYFPLMRFGDHIISVKSATFGQAEVELQNATRALEEALGTEGTSEEQLTKLREAVNNAKQTIRELKGNEREYQVEFYESLGEATARRKQLEEHFKGQDVEVKQSLKDKYLRETDGVTPTFLKKMEDRLAQEVPETERAAIKRSMRELYLQMLPERSAMKSQMRRLNVSGVKPQESLRAYAASSVRDAWYISRLENKEPIVQSMNELRFSDDLDSKLVGNELALRVAQNMHFEERRWMSAATNATYLTYLGLSPAFTFMQVTQPFVISLPVIAARHAGAPAQLLRGWRQAAQVIKVSFKKDQSMSFTADPEEAARAGVITANEAKMLKQLFDSGRIDITITHDLGASAAGRSEGWLGKATAMSAWPAHQAEVINRVSTALAAYRLEKAKLMREGAQEDAATQAAIEYADRMVSQTHLNYAAENRARLMHPNAWGGWGKIMFQFRSYQQGMLYLVFSNLVDGLRGDKEALRAVAYLAGMQLAVAGTSGLPVAFPAGVAATLLYKLFTDDDEEKDLGELYFQALKNTGGEKFALAVSKGLPAMLGLDLSQRLGMGSIMHPAAFADERKEGRDMVAAYWIAVTGGAPAGMVSNWAEALRQAHRGQFDRALSYGLPKFLADPVRGAMLGTKGLTDFNGNTIVHPEEMSAAEVLTKVLGFQPSSVSRVQEQRRAFFEAREKRTEGRSRLMREMVQARLRGQPPDFDKLREYNARHPDNRITMSDILKAAERRRAEERVMRRTGGVPVRKADRELARELGVQ